MAAGVRAVKRATMYAKEAAQGSLLPGISRFSAVRAEPSGAVGISGVWSLGLAMIGSVLALKVTTILHFQIQVFFFVLCFSLLRRCLCYVKRFLGYPMLCLFLVFDKENLDTFPQCKIKSTRK